MRFEFRFNLIGEFTMAFLRGQSRRVLKSRYTAAGQGQGFRRRFADGVNQGRVVQSWVKITQG